MKTTHRLLSMVCATLLTFTILLGIDQLAQTGQPETRMAAAAGVRA
jgi:hypothetical protein